MKNLFRMVVGLLVGGSSLLFAPVTGRCGADGLYFKADAGGNVTEDIKLLEFFGPVTPGSKIKLDPGVRFGLTAGYDVCDWFGFEGQFGIYANKISGVTDSTRRDDCLLKMCHSGLMQRFTCLIGIVSVRTLAQVRAPRFRFWT